MAITIVARRHTPMAREFQIAIQSHAYRKFMENVMSGPRNSDHTAKLGFADHSRFSNSLLPVSHVKCGAAYIGIFLIWFTLSHLCKVNPPLNHVFMVRQMFVILRS